MPSSARKVAIVTVATVVSALAIATSTATAMA